ncbi:MAG TPA: cadherin-like domain-containing protein, partial [Thermomicrobiales bacterium]|nr:cadherin-like domain-containing protein [Thermomicrobiales bacterium]
MALAAKQHQSAAVATPDAAQPFIVCKAPGGTTLRPVDSAKDCRGNEHPANLNNGQRPLGVCVQTSDGLLRLTRTTPGGSRPADCDNKAENWRQAPGDAPTNLCLGPDGNLRLCPDGAKPDFIVPAGTNATKNQATKNRPAENRPPKAVDDKGDGFTTDAAIPFTTGNVLANDRDPEGGALTVVQVKTATTKGKVTDYGDGTFGYDPNGQFDHLAPGKSATDRFTYTIADDHHQRATATVSITITGAASGPTTANPALEPAVATQTPPTGGSAVKPSAVEIWACKQGPGYLRAVSAKTDCKKNETAVNLNNRDHPLGVCVQNTSQLLQVKGPLKSGGSKPRDCKPATSTFLQLPGDSPTKLCVRLDGLLILCANSPNPDITVPALNASPVANDDSGAGFGTNEDTAFTTGDVLANDTDPDGDPLSVSALDKTGTKGKVTSNNDGAFAYDPNGKFDALPAGGNGSDSFAYTVSDGHGGTDTATVTIAITGVNDPPNAVNDTATTDKLTATTVNLLANDTDPDNGDVLSVSSI